MSGHHSLRNMLGALIGFALAGAMLASCATTSEPNVPSPRRQVTQGAPPAYDTNTAKPVATGPFSNWSAVVISADQAAAGGGTTDAFDNARRSLTNELVATGFAEDNVAQFSASLSPDRSVDEPTPDALKAILGRMMGRAGEGCLVYMTSHGDKSGIVFGRRKLSPDDFAGILNSTCGLRPTIAVVSACYSGVFLERLEAPHRMVMTASRPDRNSFGCGVDDEYPYFDACMIEALPQADGFLSLPERVSGCVAAKEKALGVLPSEPQHSIGTTIRVLLETKPFEGR